VIYYRARDPSRRSFLCSCVYVRVRSLRMDDHKIAEEYLSLVDRSLQLFGGLRFVSNTIVVVPHHNQSDWPDSRSFARPHTRRDLPQYGKQWQPYFQRTFEVYTKVRTTRHDTTRTRAPRVSAAIVRETCPMALESLDSTQTAREANAVSPCICVCARVRVVMALPTSTSVGRECCRVLVLHEIVVVVFRAYTYATSTQCRSREQGAMQHEALGDRRDRVADRTTLLSLLVRLDYHLTITITPRTTIDRSVASRVPMIDARLNTRMCSNSGCACVRC